MESQWVIQQIVGRILFVRYWLRWPKLQRSEVLFCCLMCHRVSEGMHLTCIPVSLYFRLYAIISECVCVVCIRQCDLLFSPQPEPIDSPQAGGLGTTAFCQSLEWAGGWMDYSIVAWSTQPEISHYIKLKPVIRKTMAWKLCNPVLF